MLNNFIQELKEKQISISFAKGKLKYTGPKENIDSTMLSKLKRNKNALLKRFWPSKCVNMMPINTEGDKTPVILIHGGPANYPISDYLGKDRPLYGYFYIGSEGERISYKNLEAFALDYLKQLQNIVPEGPYYIGGLSLGGHLAYEIAIQLQKQGHEVPLLFLIDAGLPEKIDLKGAPLTKRIYENLKKVYYFFYDLMWKYLFRVLSSLYKKIPKDKRNRYIRRTYREYILKYKPSDKFNGKAYVMKATENDSNSDYLGWDKFCDKIEMINFNGDHGAMYHDEGSVETIKTHLGKWINEYEKVEQEAPTV